MKYLERLWSPWRLAYIKAISKDAENCFICKAINNAEKPENLVIFINTYIIILMNKYPYNSGHLMVAPKRHVKSLEELNKEELEQIMNGIIISKKILDKVYKPEGFNIGANIGKIAGAGLETHIHFHVVPRWAGDTNFMTIISNTKVMPQTLEEGWKELRKEINNLNKAI